MPPARVLAVAPGSPADRAGVCAGDEVVTLNGEALRDVIRYQLQADEPDVELEFSRRGDPHAVSIEKGPGEPLGLELQSAVFDRVQTCDNHCPFCFIHQLPKGMRRSLYLKDDDYRLSFLYGNFTTLTRFTEADLERIVSEGLSPLYVSIHATDPALRSRLLRNRRGATSLRWLGALLDAGVEVHGQVVVCPGVNDGAALDDTLLGVLDRFPRLATVGVVPLGVSDHSHEAEMRAHRRDEAVAVVDTVERWQWRYQRALGRRDAERIEAVGAPRGSRRRIACVRFEAGLVGVEQIRLTCTDARERVGQSRVDHAQTSSTASSQGRMLFRPWASSMKLRSISDRGRSD